MSTTIYGRNNYDGRCSVCGGRVPANSGYAGKVNDTRVVWCSLHKPESNEAQIVLFDLSPDGLLIDITVQGRLPREEFDHYRELKRASGVRTSQVDGVWRDSTTVPNAGRVWKALTDAGFTVQASPRAAAAIQGAAAQQQADDAAVQSRLSHPRAAHLFPFQRVGVQWLSSRTGAMLADEMGCIDGEAELWVTRAGHEGVMTLDQLEMYFNGRGHVAAWNPAFPVKVRALVDGVIRYHTIKAVLDKGKREVVLLTLENGMKLRLTPDHEVGQWGGKWTPACELKAGDEVLVRDSNFVNTLPREARVVSVEPDGHSHVFDIVMDDPHRNFVANGIVVHNCGKTIQTLMALGDKRPVLLVVPASLKLNWAKEAAKWRPEYRVSVLAGRNSFRWPKPGELLIVNYDILPKDLPLENYRLPALTDVFANPPARLTVVADEAHSVKNAKAARTARFRFIGEIARSVGGQVWLLTGTPLLNRPAELWSIFSSGGIAKEAFGSFDRFKRLFNARDGRFGIEWGAPEPEVAECIRRVQLRREKRDVLADLPAKTHKQVYVEAELTKKEAALLDEALTQLQEHESKRPRASAADVEAIGEGMPAFDRFSAALTALAKAKTDATIDYLQDFIEEGAPFLVFSAHIEPLKKVKAALEKEGKKCGLIIGDIAPAERQRVVEEFQAGRLDAVCIGIRAGGVGLTLTRATHSVFIDLEVVPALNVQAEDRIHRIGQTMPVTIHQMILTHPLDEHVHAMLMRKMALFGQTVGASTFAPTEQAPTDVRASALTQAAGRVAVAAPNVGRPAARSVRTVTFEVPAATGRYAPADGSRTKTLTAPVPEQARPPKSAREEWAAQAIASLTAMDDDMATEENGMGWSMSDTRLGHTFNAFISAGHGLTDAQWIEALEMLGKYHGQVGRAPPLERESAAVQQAERATRRRLMGQAAHPVETTPTTIKNTPAPAPPKTQGVGEVGKGARGDVRCIGLAGTAAYFDTADGRVIATFDSGRAFVVGATYKVSFRVAEHRVVNNALTTIAEPGSFQVLATLSMPPTPGPKATLKGINDMIHENRRTFARYVE